MAESSTVEAEFAGQVQELYAGHSDPIQMVVSFKAICAMKALLAAPGLDTTGAKSRYLQEEFELWDLETRLWHLVEVLYSYRLADDEQAIAETEFSSVSVLQENVLRQNKQLRELLIVLGWLQTNSRGVDVPERFQEGSKWPNTRRALTGGAGSVVPKAAPGAQSDTALRSLDMDAPIRQSCSIAAEDEAQDAQVFGVIYDLILAGQLQEAIDVATGTDNHTLALILLGGTHDYIDPVLDQNLCDETMDMEVPKQASGARHKLLWKQAVYKLSQQLGISKSERLIYDYLCGGDISGCLEHAAGSWEELLTVHLNRICLHMLLTALKPQSVASIPAPSSELIDQVLNVISKGDTDAALQSRHPLRIVMGSVMISEVGTLVSGMLQDHGSSVKKVWEEEYLLRVMTHLALFAYSVSAESNTSFTRHTKTEISARDLTQLLILYVEHLSQSGYTDLVPLYLSLIPDDSDAREQYSKFLANITDPAERTKQLQLVRKLESDSRGDEERMANVLRRTVERVMAETDLEYRPSGPVSVQDDDTEVTQTDVRVCQAVDWYFENNMYADALAASVVVIRRFLASGKLAALRQFARQKDMKQLVKNFDVDSYTRSLAGLENQTVLVEDADKDELLQYHLFVQGLELIHDWRNFLAENKASSLSAVLWKSKHLETLIEKVSSGIVGLIKEWFTELISTGGSRNELYRQMRVLYVPYLVMELIDIYELARMSNWKYITQAFQLVSLVADEEHNDLLGCFLGCGRLEELMVRSGNLAVVALERGIAHVFL